MQIGWVDFSKTERNKVLSVLDLLSEPGTLDELGIAPVRDGFADLFFPGTSTIQTRAKYFLIIPYTMKELEYSRESNPQRLLRILDEMERDCGERLRQHDASDMGIIGGRSLGQGKWVKRGPASIYWAGLRTYGIFCGGNLSISEYLRAICAMKNRKTTLTRLGNRYDQTEERDQDDRDAGDQFHMRFWSLPEYSKDWRDDLSLKLTPEEGAFLKHRILVSNPDSMMAQILRNQSEEFLNCQSFQEMKSLIGRMPENIQRDYKLADDFSNFLFVIRTLYNIILSEGKNEQASLIWDQQKTQLGRYARTDIDGIISRLGLARNYRLCRFLKKAQSLMAEGDTEGLKNEIRRREQELKQGRAKTAHPGEFKTQEWYGGGQLDYRFGNAKTIIRDILESGDQHA